MAIVVSKITIYPIKSFDGIELKHSSFLESGVLQFDREFAFYNEDGRTVNGKKYPQLHSIRTEYQLNDRTVKFSINNRSWQFHLDNDRKEIENWLSNYLNSPVTLKQNTEIGFMDDDEYLGPTIISKESLDEVQKWFPQHSIENIRARFRANIEIEGCNEAFWEDQLFGELDETKQFLIGNVNFEGIKPCPRCVVPSRDPFTGEKDNSFQKFFAKKREETLPSYSHKSQFKHYYMLSVNTKVTVKKSDKISIGDTLSQ